MSMIKEGAEAAYRHIWEAEPTSKVQAELDSWTAHFAKHEGHYSFHKRTTHPDELTDGERVMILKDILRERVGQSAHRRDAYRGPAEPA